MADGLYARYQEKGITLDEMQDFHSCDTDLCGICERELPGLTAADNASYLAYLMAQTVRLNPDKYRSSKNLSGEVVLFFGEETGVKDKDGQPVVRPTEEIARMKASDFVDWRGIQQEGSNYGGKDFAAVQDVLSQFNGTEKAMQKKMKKLSIEPIKPYSMGR